MAEAAPGQGTNRLPLWPVELTLAPPQPDAVNRAVLTRPNPQRVPRDLDKAEPLVDRLAPVAGLQHRRLRRINGHAVCRDGGPIPASACLLKSGNDVDTRDALVHIRHP